MTTYDNGYRDRSRDPHAAWPDLFSDRIVRMIERSTAQIARNIKKIATRKRQRDTDRALAGLSENILHDIGWPDLYERQHRKDEN
ncbi:hypothetical protein C5748_02485 [Phyllobacterium phragmitis]|uniref:DUF1127 domain-containing protein n=1 Tax=Phyllobacterium phragmitis TaxID=2670329 RepID=A0A2S9IX57_9HYPH|nr:hypothetical protein [Phyllobacterium phragmitis]PRD45111.1 hypothetical protein C5748_02485 [Phyllobacterium phragmitis]